MMSECLPDFSITRPKSVEQAVSEAQDAPSGRFLAGGTDLIVNMRRGLVETGNLIDLTGIPELRKLTADQTGLTIGAGVTLSEISANESICRNYGAIAQASSLVAGPGHRAAATIGGNLCLDTRCLYYNQSHWWRQANDYCLKFKGDLCHVAPAGKRCRAAFSGDMAPALMVHDAKLEIAGPEGRRQIAVADLYREDGADHLQLEPGEFIVAVQVPPADATTVTSAYAKVGVRNAIDFPLAGIAVACHKAAPTAHSFAVAITGTNSAPVLLNGLERLSDEDDPEAYFADLDKLVQKQVSPQRTSTTAAHYRRLSAAALAQRLARELSAL